MAKVIGVKFKNSGKSYFFDPLDFDVHKDDHVIVETGKGIDYGFVVSEVREIAEEKLFQPLKPILRKATDRDEAQVAENHEKEKEAFRICQEKVHEHNLDMKLTEAEYAFDNSKILFYFTSEGYVDFRDLVKDLAGIFRTRIELRQIGVRDEARAIGGLGACGRPMCCATYLADFVPVSIKMAKEQNLPLNPTKISGVCGRLMCCLKNEEETYEELNKTMPAVGDIVEGNDGLQGEVFSTNVLRQLVKVLVEEGDEKELHEYEASQITIIRRRKGKKNNGNKSEEIADEKQLAALEDKAENIGDDRKRDKKRDNRDFGAESTGKDNNRQNGKERDNREARENKDRDNRENRENKDRDNHENRENKDRDNHENRENRERDNRENRENKDRDNHENRENRDRDNRENRENRDRDNRENRENKDRDNRENRENRDYDNREKKENRDSKDGREREGREGKNRDRDNRNHDGREKDGKERENRERFNRDNRDHRRENDRPREERGQETEGGRRNRHNRNNRNNEARNENRGENRNQSENNANSSANNVGSSAQENGSNVNNNSANDGNNGNNGGNHHHGRRHFNRHHGRNREGRDDRNNESET